MERDHYKDLGIYERIILKWIFNQWNGEAWARLLWLRKGSLVGRL
jgi:hypothetical protein